MYNEELENLIEAALADGELTEKEKQVLFQKAQSMGVNMDEFEVVIDARLHKAKQASNTFNSKSGGMNAQKLYDALQEIDLKKQQMRVQNEEEKQRKLAEIAERYQNESKLVKMVGGKKMHERKMEEEAVVIRQFDYASDQLDEKIEEEKDTLIENFPLPDGKVDLMDLLAMAVSKAKDNSIWREKTDQIYQKILLFANNDPQLVEKASNMIVNLMRKLPEGQRNFTTLPPNVKAKVLAEVNAEIDAEKQADKEVKKKIWIKYGTWGGACLLIAIILMISGTGFLFGLLFIIPAIIAYRMGKKAWDNHNKKFKI